MGVALLPYHESDHVLNLAYNVLCGGTRLEDIERLRHDTAYMNALGADLIPDPTTAGDFCRRFREEDVITLMECINAVRAPLWQGRGRELPKGTVLLMTSVFDNTEANLDNSDPNQWVTFGRGGVHEMSHAWIGIADLTQEEYDKLKAERDNQLEQEEE